MSTERISVREACRNRLPLSGPEAQAMEGALAQAEAEIDRLRAENEKRKQEIDYEQTKKNDILGKWVNLQAENHALKQELRNWIWKLTAAARVSGIDVDATWRLVGD